MKGQDPSLSSSSRRESSPAPEKIRSKSIGCMSGIFQVVYKYHNRRRFLTFGKFLLLISLLLQARKFINELLNLKA